MNASKAPTILGGETMAHIQLVVFELNGEEYGVDALAVSGILRPQKFKIYKVPGLPDVIEGMIDLRGQINYIFNLGIKLGLKKTVIEEFVKNSLILFKAEILVKVSPTRLVSKYLSGKAVTCLNNLAPKIISILLVVCADKYVLAILIIA